MKSHVGRPIWRRCGGPTSVKNAIPCSQIGPRVSIETGTNICVAERSSYFLFWRRCCLGRRTRPVSRTGEVRGCPSVGHSGVPCQRSTRGPRYQRDAIRAPAIGSEETSRFPSSRDICIIMSAQQIISLITWCLWSRPALILQDRPCLPRLSTLVPHGQSWGLHRLHPNRNPTATRTASSSKRSPQEAIANARNHSLPCSADTCSQQTGAILWCD